MTREQLFLAVGDIPDEMIAEAAHPAARMHRARMWRTVAIAAAVMVLLCTAALATAVLYGGTIGYSSFLPNYFSVPSRQTLQRDIGFEMNVVDAFSNGFRFRSGHITHYVDEDTEGNEMARYDGLHCVYRFGRERADLIVEGGPTGSRIEDLETAEVYGGCEIKYFAYMNKFVPEGYELTEQDKIDKESGKYVFSFGTSEVEIDAVQEVYWRDAGLNYSICVLNSELSEAELLQMAREIIDHQRD